MGDLVVRRWTRYGKDRLYVATGDGERVGYADLETGNVVLDRPDLADAFRAAVAASLPQQIGSDPVAPGAAEVVPAPAAWRDLADRVPGESARARADEELAASRERSRVGTVLARVLDVKTDERNWRVGAGGEEKVGARLDKLRSAGWHVLHAVPVGERGSDIDHVLIGPGGVFTINTKTHRGKRVWVAPDQVRVDGHKVEHLRKSRYEADRARRLLSDALGWEPPVKPVLVYLTGTLVPDITIKNGGPADVVILDRDDVPRVFRKASVRLTPAQVDEVFDVARRSTTWQPPRPAPPRRRT
jgi:hypothetical protein